MFTDIHNLPIYQGGGEDLTAMLWRLKVIGCGLDGVWVTNACPLYIPCGALVESIGHLISPSPHQIREKVVPYFHLQWIKRGGKTRGCAPDELPLLLGRNCQAGIVHMGKCFR